MTIRVKAGAIIHNDGRRCAVYTPNDGPISLPERYEARYVSKGVAAYVDDEPTTQEPVRPVAQSAPEPPTSDQADYTSLSLDALKREMRARGIKLEGKLTRSKIIDALNQDDTPPAINAMELDDDPV